MILQCFVKLCAPKNIWIGDNNIENRFAILYMGREAFALQF